MVKNNQQLSSELDSPLNRGRRRKMVESLKVEFPSCNIRVVEAISEVPRHIFVDAGLDHLAYQDKPLPIAAGQTLSQPSTVAVQSHWIGDIRGKKVLEIGTGCGYQTSILAQMGAEVHSIERQKELCRVANHNLKRLGYGNVSLYWGDGHKGLPQIAPFEAIIVTCCARAIPQELLRQLAVGGRMVIPVELGGGEQQMVLVTKNSENSFEENVIGRCSFVPMLEGVANQTKE